MKKFIALAVALVALTGCEIEGTTTVTQPLQLVTKKNTVTLQPGSYRTQVEADDDKLQIEVKVGNKEEKVTLRPANGQKFPTQNGQIYIPAAQSGQAFDLNGVVNTDSQEGGSRRGQETCITYEPVYWCDYVSDRYGRTRRVCSYQNRAVTGWQEVEYYPVTTTTDVDMSFFRAGTNNQHARFTGSRSTTRKVYTYRGSCFSNGGGYPRYP